VIEWNDCESRSYRNTSVDYGGAPGKEIVAACSRCPSLPLCVSARLFGACTLRIASIVRCRYHSCDRPSSLLRRTWCSGGCLYLLYLAVVTHDRRMASLMYRSVARATQARRVAVASVINGWHNGASPRVAVATAPGATPAMAATASTAAAPTSRSFMSRVVRTMSPDLQPRTAAGLAALPTLQSRYRAALRLLIVAATASN